jgi:integrase
MGSDPLEIENARRSELTVSRAVEDYLTKRGLISAEDNYKSDVKSAKTIAALLRNDFASLMPNKKLKDVGKADIFNIVERKAIHTPVAARHLLVYCKGMLDWFADREIIESNPALGIKPQKISVRGKENALKSKKRERILSPEEIRNFWEMADDTGMHKLIALALKLTLVTGQRPGEVAGMHADEIAGDVWIIPADRRMKTETENEVPLSPLAKGIIKEAQQEVKRLERRRGEKPAGHIFDVRVGRPLEVGGMSQSVLRFREQLHNKADRRGDYWTPHDLRRTCRTGLAACGISSEIAERVIGHAVQGIEATYNQHSYLEQKRLALLSWDNRLQAIIAGKDPDAGSPDSNVVPIARAAR